MSRARHSSPKNWKFVLGIIVGILPVVLFQGGGLPIVADTLSSEDAGAGAEVISENQSLQLAREDIEFMNRMFRMKTEEVAYCGGIADGTLRVWLAETLNASATYVSFSTANCPADMNDALLHTHPNGNLGLSEQDMATLKKRPESILCVHGGQLTTESGILLQEIACYHYQPENTDSSVTRIPLRVTTDATAMGVRVNRNNVI